MGNSHFRSNVYAKSGESVIFAGMAKVAATYLDVGASGIVNDGALTQTGAAAFSSTVGITGVGTFSDTVNVAATLTASTLNVDGAATFDSTVGVTGDVTVTGAVRATTHLRLGSAAPYTYLFTGSSNTEASIVSEATAIAASIAGSMYLSTTGNIWRFDTDSAATLLTQ